MADQEMNMNGGGFVDIHRVPDMPGALIGGLSAVPQMMGTSCQQQYFQQNQAQYAQYKGGKTSMIAEFKDYVRAHRDLLFTVLFVLLLDHFIFGGAFKAKIESIVGSLVKKTEDRLTAVSDAAK